MKLGKSIESSLQMPANLSVADLMHPYTIILIFGRANNANRILGRTTAAIVVL